MIAVALVAVGCGKKPLQDITASTTAPAPSQAGATAPTKTAAGATTSTAAVATVAKKLPDPCVLLTKADAEALVGMKLQDGVKSGPDDDVLCIYTAPPIGRVAQVEIGLGDGAKKFLDIDRELKHVIEPLSGVGDEAFIEEFVVFFRVGTRWNSLRLVVIDDFDPYRDGLIALAKKIAAKG